MIIDPDVRSQIILFEQLDLHRHGDQTEFYPDDMLHVWIGKTFRRYIYLPCLMVSAHVRGKTCAVSIRYKGCNQITIGPQPARSQLTASQRERQETIRVQ